MMSTVKKEKWLLLLIGVTFLSGCVTTRFPRWNEEPPTLLVTSNEERQRLESEGDSLFKHRREFKNLESALLKWSLAAQLQPSVALLGKLARAHYLCGERAVSFDTTMAKSTSHFTSGLGFAETGLQLAAPLVIDEIKKGVPFKKAVARAPREAAHLLYWYAMNLDRWARLQGILTTMRYREAVDASLVRALEFENDVEAYAQMSDSRNESTR